MIKDLALSLMFPPSRLRFLGLMLSKLGGVMTILGLLLNAGMKATALLQRMGRVNPANSSIESMLPGLPTWFIPESAEGFVFWVMVAALGLYCMYLAKEIRRVYSWNT